MKLHSIGGGGRPWDLRWQSVVGSLPTSPGSCYPCSPWSIVLVFIYATTTSFVPGNEDIEYVPISKWHLSVPAVLSLSGGLWCPFPAELKLAAKKLGQFIAFLIAWITWWIIYANRPWEIQEGLSIGANFMLQASMDETELKVNWNLIYPLVWDLQSQNSRPFPNLDRGRGF